jgi:O-antigen/teichoic acid export membrane protein
MIKKTKQFLKQFPRHWLTAASQWISKAIISLVQIVSIRTLLLYLGEDRYAVYIIAYSIAGWASLSSFGIASALQNFISESRAKNENADKYLISALQISIILIIIFSGLILLFSGFSQEIIFRKFALSIPQVKTLPIVATVAIISVLTVIFQTAYQVYLALHKGFITGIFTSFAAIFSMAAIVLLNRHQIIPQSIILALLIFCLPQMLCALILFIKIFQRYFLHIFCIHLIAAKELLIRGLKFYGISIFYTVYMQMDYIIISQTLSPNSILEYNIFLRFFMMPIFLFITFAGASWPRFSEMFVSKNFAQIKTLLKRYFIYATVFVTFCAIMIYLLAPTAIKLLMPSVQINYSSLLVILFFIYTLLTCWGELAKVFLYSINALRVFWIYMPIQILISLPCQFFLSKKFGPEGIVMGFIISILLTIFWIAPLKIKKVLKQNMDKI